MATATRSQKVSSLIQLGRVEMGRWWGRRGMGRGWGEGDFLIPGESRDTGILVLYRFIDGKKEKLCTQGK